MSLEASRTRILDAAEVLFATQGFKPTTIKDIGDRAGVNSALIYYYFGSKESLYQVCIERVIGQLTDDAASRIEAATTPDEIVTGVVTAQAAFMAGRMHLQHLMVREMVDWQAQHAVGAIQKLSERIFLRLRSAIEAGQASGLYRADVNPTFASISIISQVAYLLLARPVVGVVLGRGTQGITDQDVQEFGDHAARFARAALHAVALDVAPATAPLDPGWRH